jgi:hypothetical protein
MTWLLLVTRKEDSGGYEVVGGPHPTKEAAEKEGAQLEIRDPTILSYQVVETQAWIVGVPDGATASTDEQQFGGQSPASPSGYGRHCSLRSD